MPIITTDDAHYKAIAAAIREQNGETGTYRPHEMAPAILAIKGSGAELGEPLDPVRVYKATRPSDWLPMPTPSNGEMFMLFHIPDGRSSLLAFTVSGGDYTVALGTVRDGEFVQSSSTIIANGSKYEAELFAADFGDLTSDGMKQVMVKITCDDIDTFSPSTHSKKSSPSNYAAWNIVEISCNITVYGIIQCGNSKQNLALNKLRYFSFLSQNYGLGMSYMFANCKSLIAVTQLDTAFATMLDYMFTNCQSLTAIPQLNTQSTMDMSGMFKSCGSLTAIPYMDTQSVGNMSNMFENCYALSAVPQLNTKSATNMSGMFWDCGSLSAIPQLDTQNATDMSAMFDNCYALEVVPQLNTQSVNSYGLYGTFENCYSLAGILLTPTVTGWAGDAISLKDCSLGHTAIIDFFNSLPTVTDAVAITLTGNPGASELTDAEKAIATEKGWTLTL